MMAIEKGIECRVSGAQAIHARAAGMSIGLASFRPIAVTCQVRARFAHSSPPIVVPRMASRYRASPSDPFAFICRVPSRPTAHMRCVSCRYQPVARFVNFGFFDLAGRRSTLGFTADSLPSLLMPFGSRTTLPRMG